MKVAIARLAGILALCASIAATGAERAIVKEVTIAATPEQAWEAWTTRAGITSFFAPDAEIDARVGGAFHIYINPLAPAGLKGADDMRFMALQPPKMLSFDWNAPPSLPEVATATHVRGGSVGARGSTRDAGHRCITPAGAKAASGTRPTRTSIARGGTCSPVSRSASRPGRSIGPTG